MSFTARTYRAKAGQAHSPNSHRYKVFERAYAPKARSRNPLEELKGSDASMTPPCKAEVIQQIKRATFVAKMRAKVQEKCIRQNPMADDGWELNGDAYEPVWFEGDQMPESLVPNEGEIEKDMDEDDLANFDPSPSDKKTLSFSDDD